MTDENDPSPEKRLHERKPVILRVDYEGAQDFVGDYTENLSTGGTFVASSRSLPIGTDVRLVLSFPGLLEPIAVDGVVRWLRTGEEAGIGIEFVDGDGRRHLAAIVERLRRGDPALVQRVIRVLVVEDNPHVAELIREGIRGSGKRSFGGELSFEFAEAADGAEALELLGAEPFDVVIVDIYLPIVDGAQVIAAVRQRLGLADLPIIAVSAGGESARASALAAGANIFIDKPMRLRQVIDTMRALMKL
ncbi:MAG: TIGR02266 family protein [Myxococcales bacterium]|nr:TIGR02266 family protein [Myxococcales bacterium]